MTCPPQMCQKKQQLLSPPSVVTEEPSPLIPRLAKCAKRDYLLGGS
jgi:hypothetical protein